MSFELVQQCIDLDVLENDLSPKEKFVLVVLCRFADDSGRCYPSLPTLLGLTGFDVRTVRKAIEKLVENGWLSYVQAPGKKRQYTIASARIKGTVVPCVNPLQVCTPDKNAGGTKLHPVQICTSTPDKNAGGTPYKNAPRIKHTRNQEETNLQTVGDSSFSLEPNEAPAENPTSNTADTAPGKEKHPADAKTKRPAKRKAITHVFDVAKLPDDWRELCEQIRPDLDPQRVFVEFRFYWTQGKGQGTRRSGKGWTSTWMNWVKRQKEQRVAQSYTKPAFTQTPFDEIDYSEGINDDNSF